MNIIPQAMNESSNEDLEMLPRPMKMQQQPLISTLFILMYLQNNMVWNILQSDLHKGLHTL
jgi:hypothetical protein